MSSDRSEFQSITELRAMAEIYLRRGNHEKARQLLILAEEIQQRLDKDVLDMDSYRDDEKQA